jgi:anti-anti-sigma factor
VLAVRGELDLATVAHLRERFLIALHNASSPVVVDLGGVTFCGAEGLALLVHVRRRARLLGLSFSLAGVTAQTRRIMEITGLWRSFTIVTTVPAPRTGLDSRTPAA